tara:strand:+ start:1409 stop:1786 length:378 start_codon:yes stop_codon:yes gene_type:complete
MKQIDLAAKLITTSMSDAGVTTPQAISALTAKRAFQKLKRSTLRYYVSKAFDQLVDTGEYRVELEGNSNKLISLLDKNYEQRDRIRFEAAEMRKEGTPRKHIVKILSEDFGLTKGSIDQYLKGTN